MSERVAARPDSPAVQPDASDALGDDLGWTLGVTFRAYVRTANHLMEAIPGGPRGYQVLAAAANDLPVSQGALAARLGIDKTVMTYLVDDLEKAGLVERRPDPSDRRHKRLVATEGGARTWSSMQARLEHAEDHVLAPLDPAERSTLRDLLQRVAMQAQSLDPVANSCVIVEELASGE